MFRFSYHQAESQPISSSLFEVAVTITISTAPPRPAVIFSATVNKCPEFFLLGFGEVK